MCGILFICESSDGDWVGCETLAQALRDRGPDHFKTTQRTLLVNHASEKPLNLTFAASVLALRGETLVEQPLEDPTTGSLLCWNGEAWSAGSTDIVEENDAAYIFPLLLSSSSATGNAQPDCFKRVKKVVSSIVGPFAFVFFDAPGRRTFYARDALGRRSLVTRCLRDGSIAISSVSCGTPGVEWEEVLAGRLYVMDLSRPAAPSPIPDHMGLHHVHWEAFGEQFPNLNRDLRPSSQQILHAQRGLVNDFLQVFENSVRTRLIGLVGSVQRKASSDSLAVLFSGGLDCTLIARVLHKFTPQDQPIDLLNVAFENPRLRTGHRPEIPDAEAIVSTYERCPDRITARASHRELTRVCPTRNWRLVTINIPFSEVLAHRLRVVRLMHPHNTEMDLSIALALYFAARGSGIIEAESQAVQYQSRAKTLFSGLGADELFGGYGRHFVAWKKGGNDQLADELDLDFRRIGSRNLGRDDRVISCWGKEVRYPFLDEDLVAWALQRPVWEKCDFAGCSAFSKSDNEIVSGQDAPIQSGKIPTLDGGLDPAKGLLRALAKQLGLNQVAKEKKRAIQFGARTAKMQSTKAKGTATIQVDFNEQ